MSKATPIKVSFNAGELSPLLDGRTDQAKYFNGCSLLENFLPTVQGPLIRRGGTYFTAEVKDSSARTWLRRFQFNVTQSYQLEFGDRYIRLYTNRGIVQQGIPAAYSGATNYVPGNMVTSGGSVYYCIAAISGTVPPNATYWYLEPASGVYEIPTPYLVADLTDSDGNFKLTFEQSGDVLYMFHPSYQTRKLSRLGNTNWVVSTVSLTNGPFKDTNTDATSLVYASGIFSTTVTGAANNGAGLIRLTVASSAGISTGNQAIVKGITGTVEANGQWPVTVIDATHIDLQNSAFVNAYTAGGTVDGSIGCAVTLNADLPIFQANHVGSLFYIEKNISDTQQQWESGKAITTGDQRRYGNNSYIAMNTVAAAAAGSVAPTHTVGTATDGNAGVKWLYVDSGYGLVQLTGYTSATQMTGTIVSNIPAGAKGTANKTYLWAHSLFSTVEGWAEMGALARGRLSLVKGIRQAFSVSGDYENFARKIGGSVTPDAAIIIPLPDTNPVRWIREGNDVIIGTAGKEIAVGEVTTTQVFGPSNVKARRQTTYGSRLVEPVEVGDAVIFVTRSGQKLREVRYSYESNSYVSSDLTTLSEHIARAGLSQICWQPEPYGIVWGCTTDGQLVGFTYNREQDVLAWHRHPIGGSGIVESVSCIPSPDGKRDDLWLIVRRTINGVTKRYVEYMVAEFTGDDTTISDAFYVDCGLTYSGASTSTISGLTHLAGKTVDILANGGVHPQKTVSVGGTLTLDYAVTKAQIGLPAPAKLRTMRLDAGSPLGTAQGKVKRITRIIMRFLKTLGGKFGPTTAPTDEIQYRNVGDNMDTPVPLFSGDKNALFSGGHETEGYVNIVNDSPVPMTIITIVTDLNTNEY